MRILIFNNDNYEFMSGLYKGNPGLSGEPYERQMQARWDSLAGMANFYSANLKKLGHEAWDVTMNLGPAQQQWARENNVPFQDDNLGRRRLRLRRGIVPWIVREQYPRWIYQIMMAQLKHYKPDILLCLGIEMVGSQFLREASPYYRVAVGQHAAPIPLHDLSAYRLILSSLPNQVEYFQKLGVKSRYFRLGFEPSVLEALERRPKKYDLSFVGGLGGPHQLGTKILESLCARYDVSIWGYGFDRLDDASPLRKAYQGRAWGKNMYQIFQDSKIVLNRHIDVAENYANNLRLYEATGVGSLLLTDAKSNLSDLFDVGGEIAAYKSVENCLELTEHFLSGDSERETIADAGQKKTLSSHNYYCRMQEMETVLKPLLD